MSQSHGNFLSPKEAKIRIREYSAGNENNEHWAWAHVFSLEKVKSLIGYIDAYNSLHPNDQITGIRIYYAKRSENGLSVPDLVLVGCKEEELDHPEIHPKSAVNFTESTETTDGILGNGHICPNRCN